ncbi:hypothetical protein CRYUN_Cryun37aG0109900 [Craigia yunnanensis]
MARIIKSCMQSILKGVNLIMAMVGIAMILYGFWMIRVWQRDMGGSSFDDFNSTAPWFIYTFLGTGITLCLLTCLGHVAADSANGFCLFCYMVIISVLLLVETGIAADVLLNSDWEKDLPEDPTGRFYDFKEFVQSNIDIFQWIGLLIILGQVTLCYLFLPDLVKHLFQKLSELHCFLFFMNYEDRLNFTTSKQKMRIIFKILSPKLGYMQLVIFPLPFLCRDFPYYRPWPSEPLAPTNAPTMIAMKNSLQPGFPS